MIEVGEQAQKSIVDENSDSLLAPQRYAEFESFFHHFDVSNENALIASVHNRNNKKNSDLWIIKGTGAKVRLSNTSYNHFTPSFSSNAKFIYFTSYRGKLKSSMTSQDSYLWRYPSSGIGGITRIGSGAYLIKFPVESPNGEMIAYSAIELFGNQNYIWYMNKNGSLPTQLKKGTNPKWIDNNTLIFQSMDENSLRETIWTCTLDGSNFTQIISDSKNNCIQPYPSPNGDYVAFVKEDPEADNPEQARDVYVYNLKSGLSQQITTNKSRDDLPTWSSDGSYLFFRSSRGVGWNIWRMSTDFLKNS